MKTKWEPPRDIDLDALNRRRARSDWRDSLIAMVVMVALLVLAGVVW